MHGLELKAATVESEARQTRMLLDRLEAKVDKIDAKLDSFKKP